MFYQNKFYYNPNSILNCTSSCSNYYIGSSTCFNSYYKTTDSGAVFFRVWSGDDSAPKGTPAPPAPAFDTEFFVLDNKGGESGRM